MSKINAIIEAVMFNRMISDYDAFVAGGYEPQIDFLDHTPGWKEMWIVTSSDNAPAFHIRSSGEGRLIQFMQNTTITNAHQRQAMSSMCPRERTHTDSSSWVLCT
jgi:hypothetical protein